MVICFTAVLQIHLNTLLLTWKMKRFLKILKPKSKVTVTSHLMYTVKLVYSMSAKTNFSSMVQFCILVKFTYRRSAAEFLGL